MDAAPNSSRGSSVPTQSSGTSSEHEPTTLLPEEMWLNIFQRLNRSSLDQARLVCRCWNRIVGSASTLMNKYVIRVDGRTMNERRTLFNEAILASSSRFTTVQLYQIAVKDVQQSGWWHAAWKKLGETVQLLRISDCRFSTELLLNMLSKTPNLKMLYCATFITFKGAPVGFQLNQLHKLVLRMPEHAETVNVFRKICPHLKQLEIFGSIESIAHEEAVVAFVKSIGHTLEDLEFEATKNMLDKLRHFPLPHLNRLCLQGELRPYIPHPEQQIVRFIKSCSTIKTLNISSAEIRSEALLHDMTEHLPNLTVFCLRTWPDFAAKKPCKLSFLRNLPHLEVLHVRISGIYNYTHDPFDFPDHPHELATLDLDGRACPSLKMLFLYKHLIPKSALQIYFSRSQKLKTIYLYKCRLQASDIVSLVSQLQSLEELKLDYAQVIMDHFALTDHNMKPSKLRSLEIGNCLVLMPNRAPITKLVITLLMRCPAMEQLHFYGHEIEDSVFDVIQSNLVHLKKLKLVDCRFSKERLAYLKLNKSESLKEICAW